MRTRACEKRESGKQPLVYVLHKHGTMIRKERHNQFAYILNVTASCENYSKLYLDVDRARRFHRITSDSRILVVFSEAQNVVHRYVIVKLDNKLVVYELIVNEGATRVDCLF